MSRTLPNLEKVVSKPVFARLGPFSRLFFHLSVTQYWLLLSAIKPVINYVNEEWCLLDGWGLNVTPRCKTTYLLW
ncbi:MAG TPA: hypothetical protein VKA91_06525 [Nitrososphaeraceae archaeon]|nr:hypothetical protein [Nitrososphaeraceae archaeon]